MSSPAARPPKDDEQRERDDLRRVMPLPDEDAADDLADALARSRFRAEQFGSVDDIRLDRYVLRRELGRGGMGVVFEAYDPVLMIPVALKLLQRGATSDTRGADNRRQREAQALATVRGEHVVQVFSAGFYREQAWIAMEFVAGPNLFDWLRFQRDQGPVGWRAVLPKFIDAARGLQSIHLAGLIHRDFKPQNAVVDPQGRVRVLDFGLATTDRRPVEPAAVPAPHLRSPGLTRTGELVGTTRYASPEQFFGTDLDHRSDQFSFCVALFEALWGHPPLGDAMSVGKRLADSEGALQIPRPNAGDVPKWLTSAVLRGLAFHPADRFPDMAALLHELTRDRRRPYVVGGGIAGSLLCGGLLVGLLHQPPDELATCLSGQSVIDPLAVGEQATRHVDAWQHAYATACHDTHRGSAPDTLLARRQDCLERDRKTLAALLDRAPAADRERLVGELPPPANCLDVGLGRVAAPRDPTTRARVAHVDDLLALAEAGRMLGAYAEAVTNARAAVVAAEAAGHLPAVARAHFVVGALERHRNHRDEAESALVRAASDASRAGDLELTVDAWHELVRLALLGERAADNAAPYLRFAGELLTTLPADSSSAAVQILRAEHADMCGLLAYAAGRPADAVAAHSDAILRWQGLLAVQDVGGDLAASYLDRGRARSETGDHPAALADHQEALRRELERYHPDHPSLAINHRALGQEYYELADYPAAERELQRARAIDAAAGDLTGLADDLVSLARFAFDTGAVDRAAELASAAQDTIARNTHASLEQRADAEYLTAFVADVRDDPAAESLWARAADAYAQVSATEALRSTAQTPGARAACQQALAHLKRGHLALLGDRATEAAEAVNAAEVAVRRVGGLDCPANGEAIWLRGRISIDRGDLVGALPLLEEALVRTPEDEPIRSDMLRDLAETLHALRRDPQYLRVIVLEAQRHYRERNLDEAAEALGRLLLSPPARTKR